MRTFDSWAVANAIDQYAEHIIGLDISDWLSRDCNVALINANKDIAMFERQWKLPSVVCGHYFFFSRGRAAIGAAKEFLLELFTGDYGVEVITGLTPIDHKAALWMNRKLGFKEHGVVDTETGLHKFVMLTKQEWLQLGGSEE